MIDFIILCRKIKNKYSLFNTQDYVLDIGISIETGRCSWPATKDELIDYAMRSGAPLEVIENLQEMEDEGEIYEVSKIFGRIILVKEISF